MEKILPWDTAHLRIVGKNPSRFHRDLLCDLLRTQCGAVPEHIAVLATRPVSADVARGQLEAVLGGLQLSKPGWGLVVAAHPAQQPAAMERLLRDCLGSRNGAPCVAMADLDVGARGCLGGAEALITASSTCGIEALLLDVPVLERALGSGRTLGLSSHGAAQLCTSPPTIAAALAWAVTTTTLPHSVKDVVCRWDGRAAVHVADLLEDFSWTSGMGTS